MIQEIMGISSSGLPVGQPVHEDRPFTSRGPIEVLDPRPDPQPLIPVGVHEPIVMLIDEIAPARLDEPSLDVTVADDWGDVRAPALAEKNKDVRNREEAVAGYP